MARVSTPALAGTVGTTDNAIVRADGTGGKTAQGSGSTVSDNGGIVAESTVIGEAAIKLTNNSVNSGGFSPPLVEFSSTNTESVYIDNGPLEPLYGGAVVLDGVVRVNVNGVRGDVNLGSESGYPYYLGIYVPECFLAGTRIDTPDGQRPIEEIQVGDKVYSMNPDDPGVMIENEVTHALTHPNRPGYLIINERVKVTSRHKVYSNGSWKPIGEVAIGDWMLNQLGEKVWIYQIEEVVSPGTTTHNLKLKHQGVPNYFAEDLLVHNKCPFLYSFDPAKKYPWVYENTFIYELDSPEKKATQRRKLRTLTNKFYIRELEPETSYIEKLQLIAVTPSVEMSLRRIDKRAASLTLSQGDIIPIEFEPIPEGTTELYLEATGYYIENK